MPAFKGSLGIYAGEHVTDNTARVGRWLRVDIPPEGTTASVFIREGHVVRSSPRLGGMFPGWTEASLRAFAADAGWIVEEVSCANSDPKQHHP